MRVNAQTLAAHRAAILDKAGSLFRGRGFGGVGVADITRAAGLTHGAFYGHFDSKTALAEEACRSSLLIAAAQWRKRAERARSNGRSGVAAIVEAYLSEAHRDAPEGGCVLASLGPEAFREPALRDALRVGTEALASMLAEELVILHPDLPAEDASRRAMAVLAAMNGGLILARLLSDAPDRSREALRGAATLALTAAAAAV